MDNFIGYFRKVTTGSLKVKNQLTVGNQTVWASTGNTFLVDSTATNAADTNTGKSWSSPLATLDGAINKCTANSGDVILLAPGHAETYTTTGAKATFDIAGIRVVSVGEGAARATFNFNHVGATFTISAASTVIENVLFVSGVDQLVTFATISGNDTTLLNCETRDTGNKEVINGFTCTGDRLLVIDHFHNGDVATGVHALTVFNLTGVDNALFYRCRLLSKAVTAVINFATACTNIIVKQCDFLVTSVTNFTKSVVDTATGSTWEVNDCFDLAAGSGFSGGSGGALAGDDVAAVNTNVLAINTKVGTLVNTGGTATIGGILGDFANTSMVTRLTNILAAQARPGSFAWGVADAGTNSTTVVPILGLAGYGDDFFNNQFYMQILKNANSAGNAPEKTTRKITDYVSATGTFTMDAFGAAVEASDICLILHETSIFIGSDNADNVSSTTNVVANADGSTLERLEYIQSTIKGTALKYNDPNYLAVSVSMARATWNTVATHEVFDVTGLVRMRILVSCTASITDAGAGAIQFGVAGTTNAFIASTDTDGILISTIWADNTPGDTYGNFSSLLLDKIVNTLDVGYEVTGAALTGGTLVFHCWWEALNATGSVVAGAGGVL